MSEGRAGNGQAQPDTASTRLPRRDSPTGEGDAPRRLTLPPPYTQVHLEEGDVLDEAVRLAPEEGAGTLVWRKSGGLLAFAVVLEPEKPLRQARLAFFAGMAALGDALAAHCIPDKPLSIRYPDIVCFDMARLGGARFVTPEGCGEEEVPDWMVFAVELIGDRDHLPHPGMFPDSISLAEEEFEESELIIESFASYLMLYFDRWTHQGFEAVVKPYLDRLEPKLEPGARAIADGDLIERLPEGETRRLGLLDGLAACAWRDAKGPKL
jgi:hypothetical protein